MYCDLWFIISKVSSALRDLDTEEYSHFMEATQQVSVLNVQY